MTEKSSKMTNACARALGFALRKTLLFIVGAILVFVFAVMQHLDSAMSLRMRRPVLALVSDRLGTTITTFALAFVLALGLAVILLIIGRLLQGLRARPLGAILRASGVTGLAALVSIPPVAFGLALMFSVRGLPFGSVPFVLAVLVVLPGLLAGNAGLGFLMRVTEGGFGGSEVRRLIAAMLWMLASLAGLTTGLLSLAILAEMLFGQPGVGRLLVESVLQRDAPLSMAAIVPLAVFGLIGKWLAGLLRGVALVLAPESEAHVEPAPQHLFLRLRAVDAILGGIAIVTIVLGLGLWGAQMLGGDAALGINVSARLQPPSAAHPFGTDALGRDLQARTLAGFRMTFGTALLAALLSAIPAILFGLLVGWLFARRHVLFDTLADLLMLPFDLFTAIPALALAIGLTLTFGSDALVAVMVIIALPRGAQAAAEVWRYRANARSVAALGLISISFGVMLSAVVFNLSMLGGLGVGAQPPTPELGWLIGENLAFVRTAPHTIVFPAWILFAAFAFCIVPTALLTEVLRVRSRDVLPWFAI